MLEKPHGHQQLSGTRPTPQHQQGRPPARRLESILHPMGPRGCSHQGPLVPLATSCPCPPGVLGVVGGLQCSLCSSGGMQGAGGWLPSLSPNNWPCQEAGDVSAGPAGGQRDSELSQRLFLIRSLVLKKLIIRALSIN